MSKFDKAFPESITSRYAGLVDAVQSGWFNNETGELYSGFAVSTDDVVLDFGCGEGAAALFSVRQGAHVILADIEKQIVDTAAELITKQAKPRRLETCVSDTTPIPLPDAYASRVVCLEVLEHLEQPKEVLSDLARIGQPGAQYLISVPGAQGENLQRDIAPKVYFEQPNHINIFEKADFVELVESSGLIVERYSCGGFFWVMWMNLYWAIEAAEGNEMSGEIRDLIVPPFDHNLDAWAALWVKLISTPQGHRFKKEMDALLPKNQVILARKPLTE